MKCATTRIVLFAALALPLAARTPASSLAARPAPTTAPAATQPARTLPYEISLWPRRAQGVLSLTFDDAGEKHFTETAVELDKRGLKATFCINSAWIGGRGRMTWEQLRKLAGAGHEIGSHTHSHGYREGEQALSLCKETIQKEVPGQKVLVIAYPSGRFSPLAAKYHLAGRMAGKHFIYSHHVRNLMRTEDYIMDGAKLDAWTKLADGLLARQGWSVVTLHGSGAGWGEVLDMLKGRKELGVCTFGQVAQYILEARAARLELVHADDQSMKLKLTDELPNKTCDTPLTLLVKLPGGWTGATVAQNGRPVWNAGEDGRTAFEATPDAGEVEIRRK